MTEPRVTVYGAYWCPDCRRSKKFLGEQFIPYRWVDIEQDLAGEAYVLEKNNGKRIIPMIVFEDESFLVEPTNAELAKKLGLKTEASRTYYDLIIIGGGPAGLTASIYAAREGAEVLLIERSGLGRRPESPWGWTISRLPRRHQRTGILGTGNPASASFWR
jgi:thioredoxin reductase (NADPH)